jgi:ElaB/YqjD/DUF883 family membrane-anchored ribosome-binding protein
MAPRRKTATKANGDDLQGRLAALKGDLEVLQKDLRGLAGEASDVATQKMNEALNGAMETVQDMADRVEDWGADHIVTLREQIREQPLAACALAMGAGALLGAILLRR